MTMEKGGSSETKEAALTAAASSAARILPSTAPQVEAEAVADETASLLFYFVLFSDEHEAVAAEWGKGSGQVSRSRGGRSAGSGAGLSPEGATARTARLVTASRSSFSLAAALACDEGRRGIKQVQQ